eukprot:g27943.t1
MNTAVGLLEAPLRLLLSRFELRSCFGGGSSTSNSGIKEEGAKQTARGGGVVLELPPAAVERLSPHACDYLLRSVTSKQQSWWSSMCHLLRRRWLLSAVNAAVDEPLPLVLPIDLDPFEVSLDGYSFDLKMPSMRFAVVFQMEVTANSCHFVRVFAAFPDQLIQNLARSLQEQIQQWDLRELDPRFAGFTQPALVSFDLEMEWTEWDFQNPQELRHGPSDALPRRTTACFRHSIGMTTWASPRGESDVVNIRNQEWNETSQRRSLLRHLDLRFQHPDQEQRYKQGLVNDVILGGLVCIGCAATATLFATVPTLTRELSRDQDPLGETFGVRDWVFIIWSLNLVLMLSFIVCGCVRFCKGGTLI